MISLPIWLSTKRSALNLLDMAYVVVLIPLVIMLKVPMILFSVMMLAILLFKHTPAHKWLILFVFFVGVVAVYLSLYGAFNFRGLSRLKLFFRTACLRTHHRCVHAKAKKRDKLLPSCLTLFIFSTLTVLLPWYCDALLCHF